MQHESGNGQRCCTRQDHHARPCNNEGRQAQPKAAKPTVHSSTRVQRSMRQRACNLKHATSYDVQDCNAAAQHGPADSNRTALPCLLLAMDLERLIVPDRCSIGSLWQFCVFR